MNHRKNQPRILHDTVTGVTWCLQSIDLIRCQNQTWSVYYPCRICFQHNNMSRLADFLWHVMTHGSPTVWNMRRTKWQKLSKDIQTQHSVEVTSTGCVRVSNFLETRVSPQLCPCDWQFAPISGHIVLKHIKYSECADDEGPQFPCAAPWNSCSFHSISFLNLH